MTSANSINYCTELHNLAKNILLKKNQLGISLKELSEISNVSYSILTKLVNHESVMPNLSTLKKIAIFFNLKVSDLLKFDSLPQYIPKFACSQYSLIIEYLKNSAIEIQQLELNETYINEKSFAIDFEIKILEDYQLVTFIFVPANKFIMGKLYLIKSIANEISIHERYFFVKIVNEYKDDIMAKPIAIANLQDTDMIQFKLDQVEILGLAIRQKMLSNL